MFVWRCLYEVTNGIFVRKHRLELVTGSFFGAGIERGYAGCEWLMCGLFEFVFLHHVFKGLPVGEGFNGLIKVGIGSLVPG